MIISSHSADELMRNENDPKSRFILFYLSRHLAKTLRKANTETWILCFFWCTGRFRESGRSNFELGIVSWGDVTRGDFGCAVEDHLTELLFRWSSVDLLDAWLSHFALSIQTVPQITLMTSICVTTNPFPPTPSQKTHFSGFHPNIWFCVSLDSFEPNENKTRAWKTY